MAGPPSALTGVVLAAIVADLLLVSMAAAIVAPVPTTGAVLSSYDALPAGVRGVLGDSSDVNADKTRGPLGDWLAGFYDSSLEGDRAAQLALSIDLGADLPRSTWTAAPEVNVTWRAFDGLLYRVVATASSEPPLMSGPGVRTVSSGAATVALPLGEGWVHVQAARAAATGPVSLLGPFLSDPTPPPAPEFPAGARLSVDDYHFTLRWDPVFDTSGIVAYHVEISRNGRAYTPEASLDGESAELLLRNRPNGNYWFRVSAENGAGLRSLPSEPLLVVVEARANLAKPGPGAWHNGVNATYDSVLHLWDISTPWKYATLADLASPDHGGLSASDYTHYTQEGWGIETKNETLISIVEGIVDDETNSLLAAMKLYEWLFNATDYDFGKFEGAGAEFQSAGQTFDRGLGICGDLTALYVTVLRIAGIPARPVHGYLINNDEGIGGFHMWAEVFLGGATYDPTGGGWLPVDVSGVTGRFQPKYLDAYFGVANPGYLQLGVQQDLGDAGLDPDHDRNRWNVWANLQYAWSTGGGGQPSIDFDASAHVTEDTAISSSGRLWFNPATHERVFCEGGSDTPCSGDYQQYFTGVKGRSVRHIDYGADVAWEADNVNEIKLKLKFPETPAPNQVVIYTTYSRDGECFVDGGTGQEIGAGFLLFVIPGDEPPCSS